MTDASSGVRARPRAPCGKTFPASSRGAPEVVALERVTYSFKHGELVSLLGPSGCGKTTLLRILAGMSAASSGRVEVRGRCCWSRIRR
ncbi:MAG: ATP-binding cassette domain-containing protein [Xanthobacteraceae bacterium]|nr:ATP-binding cassette domain-containing protein [Xanthobacteraceae bacterium]